MSTLRVVPYGISGYAHQYDTCPSCGAPVSAVACLPSMACPYCNNQVIFTNVMVMERKHVNPTCYRESYRPWTTDDEGPF